MSIRSDDGPAFSYVEWQLCFYCQLTLRKPVLFWPFGVGVTRPTEPKDNTLHRTVILLLMLEDYVMGVFLVVATSFFFFFLMLTAVHETSRRLSQTLRETYETDWSGVEDLAVITEVCYYARCAAG